MSNMNENNDDILNFDLGDSSNDTSVESMLDTSSDIPLDFSSSADSLFDTPIDAVSDADSLFSTPSPNPSDLPVLCKLIVVSLSKRYRSFLLWSYLWIFILLCRLLWKSHQNMDIFYKICMLFSTCLCQFNFQT